MHEIILFHNYPKRLLNITAVCRSIYEITITKYKEIKLPKMNQINAHMHVLQDMA